MAIDQRLRDAWKAHVDEVRAKVRIDDVVGTLDKQKATGRGAVLGCSPLRPDRSPSFLVNIEKGFWHDFGTGEKGDVFAFVMKRDGVDFKTAVETLAASVNLKWQAGGTTARWTDDEWGKIAMGMIERHRIHDIQTTIVEAMHACLPRRVRAFIKANWHFTDETIDRYRFGWCIEGIADLLLLSVSEGGYGLTEKDLLLSGFFVMTAKGPKATFAHRIVFPYWKGPSAVYAIGRRYDPVPASEIVHEEDYEKAKYKKLLTHDRESRPYVSEWIANEHFLNEEVVLKSAIDHLIITEGITDCYVLVQIGLKSLSPVTVGFRDQDIPKLIELCKRVRGPIYLMNDNDVLPDGRRPGYEGAMRTASALSKAGVDVRIAWLPKAEGVTKIDVNEFVGAALDAARGRGLDEEAANDEARVAVRALMLNAKGMAEALFDALPEALAGGEIDKRVEEFARAVAHTSEIQRARVAQHFAKKYGLAIGAVRGVFKRAAEEYAAKVAEGARDEVAAAEGKKSASEGGVVKTRGYVYEARDYYFAKVRVARGEEVVEADQPISDFHLVPKRVLIPEAGQELVDCEITGLGGQQRGRYVLPAEAWESTRAFRRLRPTANLEWTGNDNELAHVQGLLFAEEGVPRVRCTRILGYHETDDGPRWVTPQGTIGPFGFMGVPDIVFVDEHRQNALARKVSFEEVGDEAVVALAREALPLLLGVAAEDVILPLLGHLYAAPFASRVRARVGSFPLLNVAGTAGSGKTSLMRLLWRLQGIAPERSEAVGAATPFVLGQSLGATNGMWIFTDEFRADLGPRMIEAFERLARLAYVGDEQVRGRANLSMVSTPLVAPWAVSGEIVAAGEDLALRERFIPVHPDRRWLQEHPEGVTAFTRLRDMPLHHLAPSYAAWSLRQNVGELLSKADAFVIGMFARLGNVDVGLRVRNNLATVVMGLMAFDAWAQGLGIMLSLNLDHAMRRVLENVHDVDEGAAISQATAKDAFDTFIELAALYARAGDVREGVHYRFLDGRLYLALRATYVAVREAMLRGGSDRTYSLDYNALRAAAREKLRAPDSYVLPESIEENNGKRRYGRRITIGQATVSALVLDLRRVPDHIEAADFPTSRPSSARDMMASFLRPEIPPWGPKTGDG